MTQFWPALLLSWKRFLNFSRELTFGMGNVLSLAWSFGVCDLTLPDLVSEPWVGIPHYLLSIVLARRI